MIHLASLPPGARPSHADIASAVECPLAFIAKVLQRLTRAGLILSHRGSIGGFELSERHRSTSILEVVEAMEGPLRLNLCLDPEQPCSRQHWCPAHLVWTQGQAALEGVLKSATIDHLASRQMNPQPATVMPAEDLRWS